MLPAKSGLEKRLSGVLLECLCAAVIGFERADFAVAGETGQCGWQFTCGGGYGSGWGGSASIPDFTVRPQNFTIPPPAPIQQYDMGKVLDALRAGQEDQRNNEEHQMRMRLMQQQLENMQRQGY